MFGHGIVSHLLLKGNLLQGLLEEARVLYSCVLLHVAVLYKSTLSQHASNSVSQISNVSSFYVLLHIALVYADVSNSMSYIGSVPNLDILLHVVLCYKSTLAILDPK